MAIHGTIRTGPTNHSREGITIANTNTTVESTAVRPVVANVNRKGGYLINKSNVAVYYGYANTVTAAASGANTYGVIQAYGSMPMHDGIFTYTGDIWCICAGADTAYVTFEEYT